MGTKADLPTLRFGHDYSGDSQNFHGQFSVVDLI